jgi:ribosomal protein S18 acetylase RimI-like enzyme
LRILAADMTDATLQIRTAGPHELTEVGLLTQAAYREFYRADDPLWRAYFERIGDAAARARKADLLVAALDGAIVGTATLELDGTIEDGDLAPEQANLRLLAVAPDIRARGIGRALVTACLDRARAAGKTLMTLHTQKDMTAALRLYRSFGFTRDPDRDLRLNETLVLIAYRLPL